MTQINQPTKTWKNPRPSIYNGPLADLRAVFASLEAFLARPSFYNGIELGDGTAPTKDAEGVTSKPPTVTVDSVSITEPSQAILDQLTVLDQRASALETNPIPFVRITDVSIDTPQLAANAVTAAKLASLYVSVGKFIRSSNFVSGTSGWAIDGDGVAEFNSVIVRGTVVSPNFQTKQSGARVRMGEALTSSDEIQFISAAGGIGSIRNPQVNGFASSLRLSAGGIIDLYGAFGGGGSMKLTAPSGQIDIDAPTVLVNGASLITTGNIGSYAAPAGGSSGSTWNASSVHLANGVQLRYGGYDGAGYPYLSLNPSNDPNGLADAFARGWFATSARELKENIVDAHPDGLAVIGDMRVRRFQWTENSLDEVGFIADEVPEAVVSTAEDGHPIGWSLNAVIVNLVAAVQQIEGRLAALEGGTIVPTG